MNQQSVKKRRAKTAAAATTTTTTSSLHRGLVFLCHVVLLLVHLAGTIHAAAPCEALQEATWDGLVRVLDSAQLYGFGILCPFEISGSACQSSTTTLYEPYVVSAPNVLLICGNIVGGAGDKCLINCPQTHFDIHPNAGLALEGMTFSGSLNTSIIVRSFGRLESSYSAWKNNGQLPSYSTMEPMIFGGAIQLHENSKAILEYNEFIENEAFHGGSIYLSNNTSLSSSSILSIRGSRFYKNRAIKGGGIYAQDANILQLQSTTFTNNHAVRAGAVVHAISDTQYTSVNNKACNNNNDDHMLPNCNGVEIQTTEESDDMVCDSFIYTCEKEPTSSPSDYPPSNEPAPTSFSESPTALLVSTSFGSIQPSVIHVPNPSTNSDNLSPSRNADTTPHISIMALPTAWPTFSGSKAAPSLSFPSPNFQPSLDFPSNVPSQESVDLILGLVSETIPPSTRQTNWPSSGLRHPWWSEELKMTIAPSFSPRLRTRLLSDNLHAASPPEEQDIHQSSQ